MSFLIIATVHRRKPKPQVITQGSSVHNLESICSLLPLMSRRTNLWRISSSSLYRKRRRPLGIKKCEKQPRFLMLLMWSQISTTILWIGLQVVKLGWLWPIRHIYWVRIRRLKRFRGILIYISHHWDSIRGILCVFWAIIVEELMFMMSRGWIGSGKLMFIIIEWELFSIRISLRHFWLVQKIS